jgi:carboxyl-terminal processing protease
MVLATGCLLPASVAKGSPPEGVKPLPTPKIRIIRGCDFRFWPTGVGIEIRNEFTTGELLVVAVFRGSSAHKRGVRVNDVITDVIRETDSWGDALPRVEKTSTKNLGIEKATDLIRGKPGTKLRFMIRREGVKAPFAVDIERTGHSPESVYGHRRKDNAEWDFMIDPKSKIGYVRLSEFSRNTYRDLVPALDDLEKQGVKGLVFDLRSNRGGLLETAIKVTDLFIDDGLIASIRPRGGPRRWVDFFGTRAGSRLGFPMACLVNGETASGSEIVAAALQDHKRARLFGERTVGKGSLQNIEDIEVTHAMTGKVLRGEIKYTTATFGRLNGKNLDRDTAVEADEWGVTPDEVIALTAWERRAIAEKWNRDRSVARKETGRVEDRQLEAALIYLRGRIEKGK